MAVTFKVDDVELASSLIKETPSKELFGNMLGVHLEAYKSQHEKLIATKTNAFVMAIHHAFDEHRPLILSPDHIWLLLCQGFAYHVRNNAETLRHKFVNHDGKLLLTAAHPKLKRGTKNAWEEIIPQFSVKIRQHIGSAIHDALTPCFTTTTSVETFAYEATLMNAMAAYFDYAVTRCGIPSITLEGNLEDWQLILKQVQKFRDYDLAWWVDALEPILQEFVAAHEGKINAAFWSNIYKLHDRSGGPFITGWIVNFFPYVGEESAMKLNPVIRGDRDSLTLGDIPNGLTSATVMCDDFSEKWETTVKSGFVGISQNTETLALRPEIGWAVRDETAVEEDRQAQRKAKRSMKQLEVPEHCYFLVQPFTIEFSDGAYEILARIYVDGKRVTEKAQVDAATWAEIEYQDLFYRYNTQVLSDDEAMKLIELHEKHLRYFEDGLTKMLFIH